jgi:hypothetical protein
MRVIAAPERDVQCPRDEAIGCEGSLAAQQPRILDAFDARADALWPQPKADIRGFEPGRSLATVCHRSRPPFSVNVARCVSWSPQIIVVLFASIPGSSPAIS